MHNNASFTLELWQVYTILCFTGMGMVCSMLFLLKLGELFLGWISRRRGRRRRARGDGGIYRMRVH